MELDRENRRLEMGPEWGTRLAERMMATERKSRRQMESGKVRRVLFRSTFFANDIAIPATTTALVRQL